MNLFEKTIIKVTNLITGAPMNKMATLTIGANKIPGYADINITINANSEKPIPGARSEHNPPHFHLMASGFDASISLPDYQIIAVKNNKNKALKIGDIKNLSWENSGQMSLRRALMRWLALRGGAVSNEQNVFMTWNANKGTLSTAYFNFEQTKAFVQEYIEDFEGVVPSKIALRKNILRNSFIDSAILDQTLSQLGVK